MQRKLAMSAWGVAGGAIATLILGLEHWIAIWLVIAVYLLWTWDALPEWVAGHQEGDKTLSLGDIRPVGEKPRAGDSTLPMPAKGPGVTKTPEERIRELIDFGTDTLLYADLSASQKTWTLESWHDRTEQWKDHVFLALVDFGATEKDTARIREIGEFRSRKFRGVNGEHAKLRERLAERIKRLREIVGAEPDAFRADDNVSVAGFGGKDAAISVTNQGAPFTLVMRARILSSTYPLDRTHYYEFLPRKVAGGAGTSDYTLASVSGGKVWVAGEYLHSMQEWQVDYRPLAFEMELVFLSISDGFSHEVGRYIVAINIRLPG